MRRTYILSSGILSSGILSSGGLRLRRLYGFRVVCEYSFTVQSKRYRLHQGGVRTLELLGELYEEARRFSEVDPQNVTWLIGCREQIQEIVRIGATAALTHALEKARDSRMRTLAVWLRGRCRGTLGTSQVISFSCDEDRMLRKEVTRCLKRLSAWSELRHIAAADPCARIRRMAEQSEPRPYQERLAAYSRHVPNRVCESPSPGHESPRQAFFVAEQAQHEAGRPAKPRWLIRVLLRHIRQVVNSPAYSVSGKKPPK